MQSLLISYIPLVSISFFLPASWRQSVVMLVGFWMSVVELLRLPALKKRVTSPPAAGARVGKGRRRGWWTCGTCNKPWTSCAICLWSMLSGGLCL